jgi:hypothetical protein
MVRGLLHQPVWYKLYSFTQFKSNRSIIMFHCSFIPLYVYNKPDVCAMKDQRDAPESDLGLFPLNSVCFQRCVLCISKVYASSK